MSLRRNTSSDAFQREDAKLAQSVLELEKIHIGEDYFIIDGRNVVFNDHAKKRFWVKFEEIQTERSMNLRQMLDLLHMPGKYFEGLRSGNLEFRPIQLVRFAQALGVPVAYFLE